jgi:phytanoyl-CoA hydroxylase
MTPTPPSLHRTQQKRKQKMQGGTVVSHTHNVHMYSADWLHVWSDPAFLDLAETFLGPDVILHHTKLFQKPAERGAAFPMHQDWSYFPVSGDRCLAAIILVEDADDAMGCLRVVPGSHTLGRIADSSGAGALSQLQRDHPIESSIPLEGQAGDVIFFHSLTIHGSKPNRSDRVRKSVLAQLYAGSEQVEGELATMDHYNARLVLRGWNSRMTRSGADR